MSDIGPVQLLAVGFGPDADYRGGILDELDALEGKGLIRLLDLLFVGGDEETGDIVALDYQGDDLGALVGALLGFAFEGETVTRDTVSGPPGTASLGLTRAHLEDLLRDVKPDVATGFLLIEHVWARGLKQAIRQAGGIPLAEGFLSEEALGEISAELTEAVRLLEELEREDVATAS